MRTLLSALLCELSLNGSEPPSEFRIFKAGSNHTKKGVFLFDDKDAEALMHKAKEHGADYSIDYGHAMFSVFGGGDPADTHAAAGWFKPALRAGELWATDVTWTDKAARKLAAREFRYISPTFHRDEAGHIQELCNVALTNIPATNGLKPLIASLSPEDQAAIRAALSPPPSPSEVSPMNPKILALLGLAADATEAQALAALTALSARATGGLEATLATLTQKQSQADILGTLMAWKTTAEQVPTLTARITEIETERAKAEMKQLLDSAVADGKVAPAQVPMLTSMGQHSLEQLRAFVAAMPQVLPKKKLNEPKDGDGVVTLSAEDMKVAQLMGTDPKKLAQLRLTERGIVPVGSTKPEDEASA